ncbi:MAG: hypothetical protein E6K17_06540 [Methanobacteriota archaeon]|nr:MAG: hypothetical protein E6K17_06540 [Euryarchaeota archaeon]
MAKRFLMTQIWRIQQSYALLSLVLWGIVIALTANPLLLPYLQHNLGVDPTAPGVVAGTLVLVFIGVFALLFVFGVVYDKYLHLWRDQLDVTYDRNPYAREKLMVKEILVWRHMFLPAMQATASSDPKTRKEVAFMEKWIERSLAADPNIRRSVEEAERVITGGETQRT